MRDDSATGIQGGSRVRLRDGRFAVVTQILSGRTNFSVALDDHAVQVVSQDDIAAVIEE